LLQAIPKNDLPNTANYNVCPKNAASAKICLWALMYACFTSTRLRQIFKGPHCLP